MRPIDETWFYTGAFITLRPGSARGDHRGQMIGCFYYGDMHTPRANLASCAPELARMLLKKEWNDNHGGDAFCDECLGLESGGGPEQGHRADCSFDLLMKKAGIR